VAARENLKREGIRACYFLQFGYPGEQWKDIQKDPFSLVRETRSGTTWGFPSRIRSPNTRFYGACQRTAWWRKQNWSDSEDLSVMVSRAPTPTGSTGQFVTRLHTEVESWKT